VPESRSLHIGFAAGEAKFYDSVDELRLRPTWENKTDLAELRGKEIRLKFYLHNAELYAFQIK
jgi:hypothetical protein